MDDWLYLVLLVGAALLIDATLPAQRKRGWNNSRAATQKDVAEVLRGRRNNTQPDTAGLLLFGLLAFLAYAWLYS